MKIHEQLELSKAIDNEIQQYVQDKLSYLFSSKFHNDSTIQVQEFIDAMLYIRSTLSQKNK